MVSKTAPHWYVNELARIREVAKESTENTCARLWGYQAGPDRRERLSDIVTTVRNFARLIGVPKNTEIRLAGTEDIMTACAGFHDAHFKRPYILICEDVIYRAPPAKQIDLAIALALHEAMHILHSHEFYRRMKRRSYQFHLKPLENLLEDWRIEALLSRKFRGYERYLDVARRVLIVDKGLRESVAGWDHLPDTDKTLVIIVAYVRAPDVLADNPKMRKWRNLLGRNVFRTLLAKMSTVPQSEREIPRLARWLWKTFFEDYCQRSMDHLWATNGWNEETVRRFKLEAHDDGAREFHDLDAAVGGEGAPPSDNPTSPFRYNLQRLHSDQATDNIVQIDTFDKRNDSFRRLFDDEKETVSDAEYPKAPESFPRQFHDQWRHTNGKPRIILPDNSRYSKYLEAKHRVQHLTLKLRAKFPLPVAPTKSRSGLTSGSIDRKRLWRAPFAEDLFALRTHDTPTPTSIAVLLDASYSMKRAGRMTAAFECAAMLNEAFSNHPLIRVHFYGHTAYGDQLDLLYFGKASSKTARTLGHYRPMSGNLDHLALWATSLHFSTLVNRSEQQTFIVISDGLPCTACGEEGTGVEVTREVVHYLRRSGKRVYAIGLGDAYCETIYSSAYTLALPVTSQLPSEMANLLVRLLSNKYTRRNASL